MKYQPEDKIDCINICCSDCILRESEHCLDKKLAEFHGYKVGE